MLGFDVTGNAAGGGILDFGLAKEVLRYEVSWIVESWTPWQGDIAPTISLESCWLDEGIATLKKLRIGVCP